MQFTSKRSLCGKRNYGRINGKAFGGVTLVNLCLEYSCVTRVKMGLLAR